MLVIALGTTHSRITKSQLGFHSGCSWGTLSAAPLRLRPRRLGTPRRLMGPSHSLSSRRGEGPGRGWSLPHPVPGTMMGYSIFHKSWGTLLGGSAPRLVGAPRRGCADPSVSALISDLPEQPGPPYPHGGGAGRGVSPFRTYPFQAGRSYRSHVRLLDQGFSPPHLFPFPVPEVALWM
jgi:hypothetical protein